MEKDNTTKISIPSLTRENPVAAAIISKFNSDKTSQYITPQNTNLQAIAMSVNEKIKTNDDIVQLFPDIELCIQILTSSILSPNDMLTAKLNYQAPNIRLSSAVKDTITQEIEDHMEKYYNINNKLPKILREALFTKGSYIEAIIPESSLDDVISQYKYDKNITLEEFVGSKLKPTYDFLGKGNLTSNIYATHTLSKEDNQTFSINLSSTQTTANSSMFSITQEDLNIEITDNYKLLNMPKSFISGIEEMNKQKLYGSSLSQEDVNNFDKWFKPGTSYQYRDYIEIKNQQGSSRQSYGKPLIIKLPVESVIPVHVNNNPEKHLGYFVLLDENGTPIIDGVGLPSEDTQYYDFVSINNDNKLNLIEKAKAAIFGMTKQDPILTNIEDMYSRIVENMIKEKLKTGAFGELVDIKDNYDVYRVMFQRALKNQQTKILFLPAELVAFYAFEYRENGTGKSLIEKSAILYSIRSILLFSRIMAYLKNSTTITEVVTEIDERDPNPDTTMEKVKSEALKTRQSALPLGITNVNDLQEWCTKMGIRFKFRHPGLPNTDITTSDLSTSKVIPDDELDRIIKDYVTMSFGLTPEIVESGYNSDFATTVTAKNLLLAKRTTQMQNMFIPQVESHIHKILNNDELIKETIKKIVKSNMKDIQKNIKNEKKEETNIKLDKMAKNKLVEYITDKFINELKVVLPKPETQQANNMKEAFEDYKSTLDTVIDDLFSSDAIPSDYAGDISNHADALKAMFKTVLVRTWIANNNFIPELQQFLTKDDEGKPTFNILEDYTSFLDTITEAFIPFMKNRTKKVQKLNDKISKATEGSSGGSSYDSDDSSYDEDNEDNNENENENEENENEDMDMEEPKDEGGEGEEGGSDEGGGDDFDMGEGGDDFDMGDDSEGGSSEPVETEADKKLKEAKREAEEARAAKWRADAELQKTKRQEILNAAGNNGEGWGLTPPDSDDGSDSDNDSDHSDNDSNTDSNNDDTSGDNAKQSGEDMEGGDNGPNQNEDQEDKIKTPPVKRPYTSDIDLR